MNETPLGVGWIHYLNLLPLRHEINRLGLDQFDMREGHPRDVNQWLSRGDVALAPSSSINLLHNPHLKMALPIGIATEGAVQSVYLGVKKHHGPVLEYVKRRQLILRQLFLDCFAESQGDFDLLAASLKQEILRDQSLLHKLPKVTFTPASAASTALTQIFLKLWFGLTPLLSQDNSMEDIELVIGDEALSRRCEFDEILDLGQCWWDLTRLPFVFAIWQTSLDHLPSDISKLLADAAKAGQDKMWQTPSEYFPAIHPKQTNGLDIDLESYWRAIQYELTPRHLDSVKLYFSLYQAFVVNGR